MNALKDSTDNLLSGTENTKKYTSPSEKGTTRGHRSHKRTKFDHAKNRKNNIPTVNIQKNEFLNLTKTTILL